MSKIQKLVYGRCKAKLHRCNLYYNAVMLLCLAGLKNFSYFLIIQKNILEMQFYRKTKNILSKKQKKRQKT